MNKEVIYLEPEDDITDILTKLQQAEQKLVALVPPKKATMLRSAVNMKLVARVAKECEKIVVVVTADPAIVKMAMGARIPVAKTLNSRPVIPTKESLERAEANIQVIDEATGEMSEEAPAERPHHSHHADEKSQKSAADDFKSSDAETLHLSDDDLADSDKPEKSNKKSKDKKPTEGNFFKKYGKWFAIGIPILLILIGVAVWAFAIAPAATITVAIGSSSANFSEDIRFTTDKANENPAEGVFLVTEQKVEQKYSAELTATGEENRGEKAKGTLTLSWTFVPRNVEVGPEGYTIDIPVGATFTSGSHQYISTTAAKISWDGVNVPSGCDMLRCTISDTISIEAVEGGEQYNLSRGATWGPYSTAPFAITVSNQSALTGGTDNLVKVITEDDMKKAAESLVSQHSYDGKKMLLEDVSTSRIGIDGSFKAEPGETTSSPKVGEAIGDNTTPEVTVRAVFIMQTIAKSDVEEFIKAKLELGDTKRLYSIGSPYIERFSDLNEPARLKTTVETGPIVTEDEIFEKASGRKTGEVSSALRVISGVTDVKIEVPYFWVSSVPTDRSKVTVIIKSDREEKPATSASTSTSTSSAASGNTSASTQEEDQ